ncbi:M20/M25/M40 family metallo-hydrolase [Kordiimonas gwangyangensis]|uniref:M20/M25/M40 family metallo-hydrolase n=2 Tax=Kordiimonas gwangyangensis TaxID=288022 RepID=UPI00039F5B91|nr:M20/M25/M40 family metallo-hydrolase [Kordiimonas gwangyangensis]
MTIKQLFAAAALSALVAAPTLADDLVPLSDETVEVAKMLRDKALESDEAYDLLASLTTKVGARLAASPKEVEAQAWGVEEFTRLGFDKVWKEPVMVPKWTRILERAEVVGNYAQPLVITALGKSVGTPEGGVTAEIVHFATFDDLKAADPAMVKDKIVFISNRMERFKTGAGYGPAVKARGAGASEAARKGAKAILIRSIGTDTHRLPHTGGVTYDEDAPKIAAAALSNPDADQLVRMLGYSDSISVHLNIQTTMEDPVEMYNVVGEITGRVKPDEYVVLGSHLDSWDLGTGAVDDGAGVAITMAAANLIQDLTKERPYRSIRVVLFSAEELGLIGARQYAEAHEKKGDMANHMIGAESDFGAGPVWALASNVSENAVHVVDKMAALMGPLGIVRADRKAGGGPDVGQLRAKGMPVMDLMQDGTDYFDLHHTADDTLDKVDPAALRQNVAAWVVFTYLAAEWPGSFR